MSFSKQWRLERRLPKCRKVNHSRQPGVEPRKSLFCRGQTTTMPVFRLRAERTTGMVAFCPFQNNGAWRGAYPNAAKLTTRGNRESNPGCRCCIQDKIPLCQLSSTRLEDNWHSGLLSYTWHSGILSSTCKSCIWNLGVFIGGKIAAKLRQDRPRNLETSASTHESGVNPSLTLHHSDRPAARSGSFPLNSTPRSRATNRLEHTRRFLLPSRTRD